nr:AlpA family phage regulatory protein [Ramlibacter sp. Leaf400]
MSSLQAPGIDHLPDDALVRLALLISSGLVPWSAPTHWRKCRSGKFPAPVKVSANITAWRLGEVRRWASDPAGFAQAPYPRKGAVK